MTRAMLLAALLCSAAAAQPPDAGWDRVGQLQRGDRIRIVPRKGDMLYGRFVDWSPASIRLSSAHSNVQSVSSADIERVVVRRKASRWKAAGIGAAVGFGIMFALGATSAGYVADENNPSASTRMGVGAAMGLFGAGVGGGLGAAFGGSRYETVYRSPR